LGGWFRFVGAVVLLHFTLGVLCPLARPQSLQPSESSSSGQISLQLIIVSSLNEAQGILERLKYGDDFGSLAREKSIDPTADAGGMMGKLAPSALRAELRDGLNGVQPGKVSSVIKIPRGYAILKLLSRDEDPSPAEIASSTSNQTTLSFSSSRSVGRQMPVTSGVPAVEPAFFAMEKPAGWNHHLDTICQLHSSAISQMQKRVEALAKPENAASASPNDLLGYQYALALLESYQGHMSEAIKHWEEAYRIVLADLPESVPLMEEVLGDAYFHKAEMENDVYRKPGDRCIFPPRVGSVYPKYEKTEDVEKAIQYFQKYLAKKPDDLQVKWILNLSYMTLGQYPQGVPPQYVITEPAKEDPRESIGRFLDVAPEAGLDVFQISGGLIVEDFENNGFFDVVTSSYDVCGRLRYFHNNGDGTFTDRSAASGLGNIPAAANLIQTDYNNDGCIDILALRGGWQVPMPLSLLRNNCDGTFTDVTEESGLGDHLFATQTAAWADFDNDGWLDVLIADEQGPSQLYRNKGDGTFENVSLKAGVDSTQFTKGVVAEDYDNDGYPDFFATNLRGDNILYHNNHDGTFTDVAAKAGVQQSWFSFGTWFFDYDNDGWPDLFVANDDPSVEETMRTYLGLSHKVGTMKLYKNMRNGTFADVTAEVGLDKVFMPMGANYGDVDNDGFLDFYLGTGNPEYGSLVPDVLMRNKQGKNFADITVSSGTGELHKTHAIAFADLENNGNEDIVAEMGGAAPSDAHALRLYRNPGHDNHWIAVKLVGVKTNRAAVGARITVTTKDRDGSAHSFYRTVNSRGSWGASPFEQHVGLGTASEISKIQIWWPTSNTRQEYSHVAMDEYIQIKEFAQGYTKQKRKTYRIGGPQPSSAVAAKTSHTGAVGGPKS
jgi:tetratricopeptide (TPR) repeat protein